MPSAPGDEAGRVRTLRVPVSAGVAAVRHRLCDDLVRRGLSPRLVDDAALVLSELLTNALRHARPLDGGSVEVSWAVTGSEVEVAVSDGGAATRPVAGHPPATALGGRGLSIVADLAEHWGVVDRPGRTTVWARVTARTRQGHAPWRR